VGKISGGKVNNIVAENAELSLEIRSLNKTKLATLENKVKDIIKTTVSKYKAKSELVLHREYNGFEIKLNEPIIRLFEKATSRLKMKAIYEASGGGSDTNILNANKVRAINLSIGMRNVHTTKEHILKKDLINGTKLIVSIIDSYTNF
jgi:tripeptide aminopeptidase